MGCSCRLVVCARRGAPGLGSQYLPSACEWIVCRTGSMCWARARWGSWSLFWWDLERRSITGPADGNRIKSRAKSFLGLISGSSQLISFACCSCYKHSADWSCMCVCVCVCVCVYLGMHVCKCVCMYDSLQRISHSNIYLLCQWWILGFPFVPSWNAWMPSGELPYTL